MWVLAKATQQNRAKNTIKSTSVFSKALHTGMLMVTIHISTAKFCTHFALIFFRKNSKRCKQQIQLQDLHDTRIDSGAASCHPNEFAKLYRTDLLPAGAPRQIKVPSITYPSKRIYGEVRAIMGKSIRVSLEWVQFQVLI